MNKQTQLAWIIFTGETDLSWLKILKGGFRHCFIVMNDGERWMSLDPLAGYVDIQIHHHIESAFDLPEWLKGQGFSVVPSLIKRDHQKAAPFMAFSCVEFIKRVLGIHSRFIITPFQLYKYFKKKNQMLVTCQQVTLNRKEIYHG